MRNDEISDPKRTTSACLALQTPAGDIASKMFLFVVVLYKMTAPQSKTVTSLARTRSLFGRLGIDVLLIDNSPDAMPHTAPLGERFDYVSFGQNKGLAGAYQFAFLRAKSRGYRFVVWFDQDSEVTDEYLHTLSVGINDGGPSIGIWCPRVVSGSAPISPYSINLCGWPRYLPSGNTSGVTYGINSFSAMRVDAIEAIGGIDQFYWLDCLDFWLYERIQRAGWAVRCLDLDVKHDLSLVSGNVSLTRMKNIAFYESCFVAECGSASRMSGAVLRLLARGFKRRELIGGLRGYVVYVLEIARGASTGLTRRRTLGLRK